MADSFSQRLRSAKRELTALKTAHRRNASLMKIYSQTETVTPPGSSDYNLTITVSFDSSYSPYPFFDFRTKAANFSWINAGSNIDVESVEYSADGHSAYIKGYYSVTSDFSSDFKITSTSPITNINYSWSTV